MIKFYLFLLFTFPCVAAFPQMLEGEWKGSFTDSRSYLAGADISLVFKKVNDTVYEAKSVTTFNYSERPTDTSICLLRGFLRSKDLFYLEETKVIKQTLPGTGPACLQLMKLWYQKRKKKLVLKGNWYTEDNKCGSGQMLLTKVE